MVLQLNSSQQFNSTNVSNSYAKPKHEFVYQFAKGNLKIAGSTMSLLMYISPYVDSDMRVIIDLDDARRALDMQPNTFYLALEQARQNGFLVRKKGFYYSRFHDSVDANARGLKYQKLLTEYSSPAVLNYPLNTKRLFYYFASFTLPGTKKKVSIEHLYRNELHTNEFGINYFDSFTDLSTSILTLIKNDQINVQLMYNEEANTGPLLTKDTPELEKTFKAFFGADDNVRKERTSLLKSDKHKIKVNLTDRVLNGTLRVMATDLEFRLISDKYGICWEEMNIESRNYLASYKNELFNLFGDVGIEIYRNSISKYLKENAELVLYHDLVSNKMANFVMDFNILPTIRDILHGAALHRNVLSLNTPAVDVLCNGYLIPITMIPELLRYYLRRGSENHIVLLDSILANSLIDYSDFSIGKKLWTMLDEDVHAVYRERYTDFKDLVSVNEWKDLCRVWAERGLLARKIEFEKEIVALKEMLDSSPRLLSLRKRYVSNDDKSKTQRFVVPLYNWLEQRN